MKPLLIGAFLVALTLSPVRAAQGGNGKISGMVIQAGTARPIDGVQIILSRIPAPAGQPPNQVGAFTDQFGRFEVENVEAGRYRIQWSRPGYFTPPVGTPGPDPATIQSLKAQLGIADLYIASPPAATSVTVELGSSESLAGFVFTLTPGGVISGRVLDPMGNPLVSTSLTALTVSYEDGVKVLRPGTSTTSDDRGEFRLFGLRPGEYYVRGDYRPSASAPGEIVRTYFPGVIGLSGAVPIVVSESGESPGADFRIPNSGTATVSGTVTGLPGTTRAIIQFSLLPIGSDHLEDPSTIAIPNSASGESRARGQFELRGISPGQYILGVFVFDNPQQRSYAGSVMLDVGSGEYRNVSIEMHASADLKGRLMLEDGSPIRESISLRARGHQAALSRTPPSLNNVINTNADGTFSIPQAAEARYSIVLQNAVDSCIVDIHQGGKSVYDDGFIGGMGAEPIDVILSKQCGTVQVQILDDRKQPVSNAFVSLVPTAEHRRNPLLYRRSIFDVAAAKYPPISLIPPGEYKMFAWDSIPPNAELNAEFLKRFEDRGVPITIRGGESLSVQVPLITARN
jgi:hypothetical protein